MKWPFANEESNEILVYMTIVIFFLTFVIVQIRGCETDRALIKAGQSSQVAD